MPINLGSIPKLGGADFPLPPQSLQISSLLISNGLTGKSKEMIGI